MFTTGQYVRARAHVRGLTRHTDYVVKRANEHLVVVQAPRLPGDQHEEEHVCYPEDIAPALRPYHGTLWFDETGEVRCWPDIFGPRTGLTRCDV